MDTLTFLQVLYRGATGFVELRSTVKPAEFVSTLELETDDGRLGVQSFLDQCVANPKMLPYYGVALRREPINGRYENCSVLTCVYCDADYKEHGEETVNDAIAALSYPPSIVVNSGNGLHCYWLLTQPLYDMARASKLLDLWVRTVPVADWGVSDVPRVLRLPQTLNRKYSPPRKCEIQVMHEDLRYDADDLEAHAKQCAAERGESVPEAGVIAPAWQLPESIGAGERHGSLYKFMRSIQSRYALTFEEALPMIQAVNKTRCSPPIADGELRRYLARGWRSADRAGFERPKRLAMQDDGREL